MVATETARPETRTLRADARAARDEGPMFQWALQTLCPRCGGRISDECVKQEERRHPSTLRKFSVFSIYCAFCNVGFVGDFVWIDGRPMSLQTTRLMRPDELATIKRQVGELLGDTTIEPAPSTPPLCEDCGKPMVKDRTGLRWECPNFGVREGSVRCFQTVAEQVMDDDCDLSAARLQEARTREPAHGRSLGGVPTHARDCSGDPPAIVRLDGQFYTIDRADADPPHYEDPERFDGQQ